MRRKYWVIAIVIPLILVVGEFAYWRLTAGRLRAGVQHWLASRLSQGWEIGSGPLSISGWPQAATVNIPSLVMRHDGPTLPAKLNIASAGVNVSISLFSPINLHLLMTGPTHVRAGDGPDVVVIGDEISASMPLSQFGPSSAALHASQVRLEAASGAWHVTVGLLNAQAEVADEPIQPAATFVISAEAIALPASVKWPLGNNISSLSVDGSLNGPLPAVRDITQWAQDWRDGGGSLEFTHFAMGWGPLGLTSSATLALDEQLQPMGSGNGRIVGYAETLDRLASGGLLTKSAATAAKAVLSLMAGTTAADEPSSVDVPLTLQYRTLSMRQVPLVRLPELDWPAR